MAILPASFNKSFGEKLSKVPQWKLFTKPFDESLSDPAKFAAGMLVTSIVSKDAVGCVMYTYQSLHNKEIPEERRGFVASVDLVNGVVMVFGQIAAAKLIERGLAPGLFAKHFSGKLKNKDTGVTTDLTGIGAKEKSRLFEDNLRNTVKMLFIDSKDKKQIKKAEQIKKALEKTISGAGNTIDDIKKLDAKSANDEIEKIVKKLGERLGEGSKKFNAIELGFGIFVGAIATTALVKRTLAPLISTPLAGWVKDNILERKNKPKTKDRMYYELEAVSGGKYDNKMDKTAFSNISSSRPS